MMKMLLIDALVSFSFVTTGFAQSMSAAEREVMQIRQNMARSFMDAIKNKDVLPIGDHYTKDAVFSLLIPIRTIFLGRDAIVKRYEDIFRAGSLISYESNPKRFT